MDRSAEHTVLLPVQRRVPSKSVKAFFHVGFEKSSEKGINTGRMICDRELIGSHHLFFKKSNSVPNGFLSIQGFCLEIYGKAIFSGGLKNVQSRDNVIYIDFTKSEIYIQ